MRRANRSCGPSCGSGYCDASIGRYVSPRDYVDLLNHFVAVHGAKREKLEDQQRHLNIGVEKLEQTAVAVADLQRSLAEKGTALEEKDRLANEKLQQMGSDQNAAEKARAEATKTSALLAERNKEVDERRSVAEADLSKAEPALREAQQAVRNIKKAHLDELKALNNPPAAVKLTLECVVDLIGDKLTSGRGQPLGGGGDYARIDV